MKIATADNRELYQEIQSGILQRTTDLMGNTVEPLQVSHWVIDAEPPQPSWALPDQPPAPPTSNIITQQELKARFTPAEKIAIYTAGQTNPEIMIWLIENNLPLVDTLSPELNEKLEYLVALNLITPARKAEIQNA